VVQFLANNDTGVQYLHDAVLFAFLVSVVNGVGKKGLVSTFGTAFLRAFGDVHIALALGLGTIGGGIFRTLDQAMLMLCGAVFWSWYVEASVPKEISKYWGSFQDLSWSIIKANNAAAGYAAASSALGGFWAPLIGAWVGCNGARLLENGFSALSKAWDANDLLAAVAGLFLFVLSTHLQASAVTARALLAVWSFSGNWVDYQAKFKELTSSK
jgi:hypothetical protein